MATVRFNLKRPSAETSSIECILSDGRQYRIRLATSLSVKTKHWSKVHNKALSADPNAVSINKHINELGAKILDVYLEAKRNNILPNRKYLNDKLEAKPEPEGLKEKSFFVLWDLFIESQTLQANSLKKYKSLKAHLEAFNDKKTILEIDQINEILLEDFQTFLYKERELNTGSAEKYIVIFKIFMNWCVKRKYTTNLDYKAFRPISQPEGLKVIMTNNDLSKLRTCDLGAKGYLKNVRSLFLLACSTGLRFSDFSRVKEAHLKEDGEGASLSISLEKTSTPVSIPLTIEALAIVKDLINGKVKQISNQKMNDYVKELCEKAKIDEPFEVTKYVGKAKSRSTIPKYKLVSTHTGRRTFATNLLLQGIPAEVVMKYTGHTQYQTFAKYVNIPKVAEHKMVRQALEASFNLQANMWRAS